MARVSRGGSRWQTRFITSQGGGELSPRVTGGSSLSPPLSLPSLPPSLPPGWALSASPRINHPRGDAAHASAGSGSCRSHPTHLPQPPAGLCGCGTPAAPQPPRRPEPPAPARGLLRAGQRGPSAGVTAAPALPGAGRAGGRLRVMMGSACGREMSLELLPAEELQTAAAGGAGEEGEASQGMGREGGRCAGVTRGYPGQGHGRGELGKAAPSSPFFLPSLSWQWFLGSWLCWDQGQGGARGAGASVGAKILVWRPEVRQNPVTDAKDVPRGPRDALPPSLVCHLPALWSLTSP